MSGERPLRIGVVAIQGDFDVIGSSLLNLTLVLGGMASFRALPLPSSFVHFEVPAAIAWRAVATMTTIVAFTVSSRINSTWGGNLTDMVRSQRYFEVIDEEKLVDNAESRSLITRALSFKDGGSRDPLTETDLVATTVEEMDERAIRALVLVVRDRPHAAELVGQIPHVEGITQRHSE